MSKSGSGLGGGDKPEFGSLRTPKTSDGFTEGSFSWSNLMRAITDGLADTWFADLEPKPFSELQRSGWNSGTAHVLAGFNGVFGSDDAPSKLLPNLVMDPVDLGEPVPLEESELGQALLASLKANGVNWFYRRIFSDENSVTREIDQKIEGQASWLNDFDMPVQHSFKVYRNAAGKERVLWSAPLLAATRRFDHITTLDWGDETVTISDEDLAAGALTFGEWSTHLFLPLLLKRLYYIAETPFPSNIMSFPRKMAFGELDPSLYPTPAAFYVRGGQAGSAVEELENNYKYIHGRVPLVLHAGWTFDATNSDDIFAILQTVTSGINRMSTVVEDGFLNFRDESYPAPWDNVTFSETVFDGGYVVGESARGRSLWVPNTRAGFMISEAGAKLSRTGFDDDSLRRPAAEWITYDGMGNPWVASATNSLVFSYLIPEDQLDEAERVLRIAIDLDAGGESTNAMSNLGAIYFKRDKLDEAEKWFKRALEQKAKFAVDEQYYFLSQIANRRGDSKAQVEYEDLCASAGGYKGDFGDIAPAHDYDSRPTRVTGTVKEPTLGGFLAYIDEVEEVITPEFNGFFNIESGYVGVSTLAHPFCSVCQGLADSGVSFDCNNCGRTTSNYLVVRAGDGDGLYANYDLYWDRNLAGALTVFGEASQFALTLTRVFDEMAKGNASVNRPIDEIWGLLKESDQSLAIEYVGTLTTEVDDRLDQSRPAASLFFGDAGEGRDSMQSVIYNRGLEVADHSVYVIGERDHVNSGILVPRFLLTLRTNVAEQLGLSQKATVDWVQEQKLWEGSHSIDKPEQFAIVAVMGNFTAMRGYKHWQPEGTIDLELGLKLVGWRLQLVAIGGEPGSTIGETVSELTADFVRIAYRLRNLYTLADEYDGEHIAEGDPGANLTVDGSSPSDGGLTKSGGGLGLTGGTTKPCSRCSMPLKAGEDFCKTCGAPAR